MYNPGGGKAGAERADCPLLMGCKWPKLESGKTQVSSLFWADAIERLQGISLWDYFQKHLKNKPPFKNEEKKKSLMALSLKEQGCRDKSFPSALLNPSHAYLSSLIHSFFIYPLHSFTIYLVSYLVCKRVESFLKLRKHLAEKSQGTIQQTLPFLEKSALLWRRQRRQVCTTASLTFLFLTDKPGRFHSAYLALKLRHFMPHLLRDVVRTPEQWLLIRKET